MSIRKRPSPKKDSSGNNSKGSAYRGKSQPGKGFGAKRTGDSFKSESRFSRENSRDRKEDSGAPRKRTSSYSRSTGKDFGAKKSTDSFKSKDRFSRENSRDRKEDSGASRTRTSSYSRGTGKSFGAKRTSDTFKGKDRFSKEGSRDRKEDSGTSRSRTSSYSKGTGKGFGAKRSTDSFKSENRFSRERNRDRKEDSETSFRKSTSYSRNTGDSDYRKKDENERRSPAKRSGKPATGRYNKEERPVKRNSSFSRDKEDRGRKDFGKKEGASRGRTGRPTSKRFGKNKREEEVIPELPGNTRLNKYIANAGICSRREADNLIAAGLVSVNGKIITEMGYQVKPGDQVKYNGSRLSTEKKVYLMMNKPKDTITTLDDPDGRKIVTDLLNEEDLPRVYPVGRLDRNTTGVLVLTNDGELAQRLMHPKYQVQKIYKATLNKNIKGEDLWTITQGIELEDGFIKPDSIAVPDEKNEVVIEIHSGKNRIIHRIFEHVGYSLDKLDRIWYAGLNKKSLKRGEWRELNERELKSLKTLVKLK